MSSTQSHHLVIPFALTRSAGGLQAVPQLQLQHLPALLDRLQPLPVRHWDEYNYSTPHEHALAEALQWPETLRQDGQMPWAAHMARSHGMATTIPVAWGLVTPCHWQIQTDHVTMAHPQELELTLEEGQELLHAMQPRFAEEGLYLVAVPGSKPGNIQWLARGSLLEGLRTASLDRVCGRNVESWMPSQVKATTSPTAARAAPLQRLHSEMQMLLHTHPVNERRQAAGKLPVNSFWVSGTGVLPADIPLFPEDANALQPHMLRQLATAAQREDWDAWLTAWRWLDEHVFAPLLQKQREGTLQGLQLTLCSEQRAASWHSAPVSLFDKLIRSLRPTQLPALLQKTL